MRFPTAGAAQMPRCDSKQACRQERALFALPSRVAGFAEAIVDSYQLLFDFGRCEDFRSAGDYYILGRCPQEEFYAGPCNPEVEDVMLAELFTVATARLALLNPIAVLREADTGGAISQPQHGGVTQLVLELLAERDQ